MPPHRNAFFCPWCATGSKIHFYALNKYAFEFFRFPEAHAYPDYLIKIQEAVIVTAEERLGKELKPETKYAIRQQKSMLMLESLSQAIEQEPVDKIEAYLNTLTNKEGDYRLKGKLINFQ